MRICHVRFMALGTAAAAAMLSVPAAAQQLTIAGQWDVGAGQANYTLEFGFPEDHAKLMGTPSTQHSVIIDPPDGRIPFQPWAMAVRNARDRIHEDPAHMKSRDLDSQAKCYPTGVPRFANRGGPFITIFPDKVLIQIEVRRRSTESFTPMAGRACLGRSNCGTAMHAATGKARPSWWKRRT